MKMKRSPDHMNPGVFQENRLPPRAYFLPPQTLLLSGRWNFHLASSPLDTAPDSQDRSIWRQINVPGHWDLQGFGTPQYTNIDYPFPADPPFVPSQNPTGYYETTFTVPDDWHQEGSWGYRLRFEGVDSAFRVFLNGKEVGYSQGRTNAAEFYLNRFITGSSNHLRVIVYKWSDGSYIEDQDMWWLSGIFRDVYLLAFPKQAHIEDFFVQTSFDAHLKNAKLEVDVIPEFAEDISINAELSLRIVDANDKEVASVKRQQLSPQTKKTTLVIDVSYPLKWTAETPHLYKLFLTLSINGCDLQEIEQQVGFRTVEVSKGQLRVNSIPIEIRGVNRHDHHPRFGRAVPFEFIKHDLITMKRHNVNALRCSHYPNDPRLLVLANELGLYVMDEADLECHGMGVNFGRLPSTDIAWKGAYVDRMQNLVHRDKNQPCVIMWSLGNESWYGENHQSMYEWSKGFDVTRPVHYENDHEFRASDVESYMYTGFDQLADLATRDGDDYEKPIVLCEYLHAMGTGPGGAKEYMELFRKYRRLQGGYVWEWANHGLLRKIGPKNAGTFYAYGGDFGDEPNDGNFVMDGLCNSEHKPGPGLIELKQAYQPIALTTQFRSSDATYSVHIKNLNDFANLDDLECVLTIKSCTQKGQEVVRESERRKLYGIGAGDTKPIVTASPSRWASAVEYVETWLCVSIQKSASNAWAVMGHEIGRADFHLPQFQTMSVMPPIKRLDHIEVKSSGRLLAVSGPTFELEFDKITATILHWSFKGQEIFENTFGPQLTFWRGPTDNDKGGQMEEWKSHRVDQMTHQVRSVRQEMSKESGALEITVDSYIAPPVLAWGFQTTTKYTVHSDGKLRIHVRACPKGSAPATLPRVGLEMCLPMDQVIRCQWFGLGPGQTYRDMKEAGQLGIWARALDDMIYMYEKPQENGNRTETRWTKITNERGFGIKAILERTEPSWSNLESTMNENHHHHHHHQSEKTATQADDDGKNGPPQPQPQLQRKGFDFSISRFSSHGLEHADHPYELSPMGPVVFRIDDDHHGVGSAACGPDVQDQYQFKMRTIDFTVSLEPA